MRDLGARLAARLSVRWWGRNAPDVEGEARGRKVSLLASVITRGGERTAGVRGEVVSCRRNAVTSSVPSCAEDPALPPQLSPYALNLAQASPVKPGSKEEDEPARPTTSAVGSPLPRFGATKLTPRRSRAANGCQLCSAVRGEGVYLEEEVVRPAARE